MRADRTEIARGIAVVGSTTIDRNWVGGRLFVKPGGATVYAGITYRRCGLPAWAVTNVAEEDREVIAALAAERIGLFLGRTAATTRFVNRMTGLERRQEIPVRAAPIAAAQVEAVLSHVDALHLSPLHAEDIAPEVYRLLAGGWAFVVLDVQGCVRRVEAGRVAAGVAETLPLALACAQVVKSDLGELETITAHRRRTLGELMAEFEVQEWIVTRGAAGGLIRDAAGVEHIYAAPRAIEPVDPTGAGDVFLAAYVTARFRDGAAIPAAAELAARRAADQVRGRFIDLPPLTTSID